MGIKEHIKGKVRFQYYRDGNLYYQTEDGLTFPVPIDDAGSATFLAEDKGILFMRYIRKFLNSVEGPDESETVSAAQLEGALTNGAQEVDESD